MVFGLMLIARFVDRIQPLNVDHCNVHSSVASE